VTALERYKRQMDEWDAVGKEMMAARPGEPISCHQVTTEHRKRMLARGERLVSYEEIVAEHEAAKEPK
jgi:hypothetical protein